jgi:putative hydroxymethylpyrimidine transport system permease protein
MTALGRLFRPLVTILGLLVLWDLAIRLTGVPSYMLPSPEAVAVAAWQWRGLLAGGTVATLTEILLGLLIGTALGAMAALVMVYSAGLRRWLLPLLIVSQALPVFALAPLLVLWFGFGLASKVVMAVLIIFFPVTVAFFDGLRRTEPGWLDLARTMGASPRRLLLQVRLPAALPAFGAGLRVAAAVAPIGAVIGEWVGASNGLGYVMLTANARIETDLMFAALVVLAVIALLLWIAVDHLLKRLLYWAPETGG